MGDELDDENDVYEDFGIEMMVIGGVLHGRWDDRWLPIEEGEEPPTPRRTTLITASVDPGGGFMADAAYYELAKVGDQTLVRIDRIDGAPTEISLWDFQPGTEEVEIARFIADLRSMEPDAVLLDDDTEDELAGDERTIELFRR